MQGDHPGTVVMGIPKILIVPRIKRSVITLTPDGIMQEGEALEFRNWLPAEGVGVRFHIQHDGSSISLKFYVVEPQARATVAGFNAPVYEDSCVEFFISFAGEEPYYYNFEFNCIGAILGGYGKDRHERERIPGEILRQVNVRSSLGKKPFGLKEGPVTWKLSARIPVGAFFHSGIENLSGKQATANFYKCGDKLDKPHYLSWQPVGTAEPDFHQPRYFGKLLFQ
jgi:hypothetical protein